MASSFAYSVPAILALLIKCAILYFSRTARVQNNQTRLFFAMLVFSMFLNIAEIALLNRILVNPFHAGIAYFAFSIPSVALLLHLSISISFDAWNTQRFRPVYVTLYLYAAILEVVLLFTPWLIAGMEPFNGYSFTRVPGPLYFLYETFLITSFLGILLLPVFGLRRSRSNIARSKCKLWIVATLPMVLLVVTVVALLHFDIKWFNSTVTLPLAISFCYAVIGYAIHNYRLFDIEVFIPWSGIRKRKTEFYKRIQAVIAEIADMSSVNKIVQSLSAALRCPVVLIGGPRPAFAMAGEAFGIARFPLEELKKVDHIVVAHEIVDIMPAQYALMKRHKVAAIVPFHPHSEAAASWMLLGESFSEQVYTTLDFQVVETLFARLADHFLDKQLLLRSQLSEAQREMQALCDRLASAWKQLEDARKQVRVLEGENHRLQRRSTQLLRHELTEVELQLMDEAVAGKKTLNEFNAEFEARLIEKVLEHCDGDRDRAAELLGLTPYTLHHKIVRYKLG